MKLLSAFALVTFLTGCAQTPQPRPVAGTALDGAVTVTLSRGAAQELLLGTSAALHPTAPIPIPDNPACRTK